MYALGVQLWQHVVIDSQRRASLACSYIFADPITDGACPLGDVLPY